MIIICHSFFALLVEQCRCILQLVSVAFLDICQRTKKRMTFHKFSSLSLSHTHTHTHTHTMAYSLVFRMQSGRWAVKDFEIWLLKEFVWEFKRDVNSGKREWNKERKKERVKEREIICGEYVSSLLWGGRGGSVESRAWKWQILGKKNLEKVRAAWAAREEKES